MILHICTNYASVTYYLTALLKCVEQEQEEDVTTAYELLQQELEQATETIAMKQLTLMQQTSQFFWYCLDCAVFANCLLLFVLT